MKKFQLGILGCGNMAAAILENNLKKGVLSPSQVLTHDRFPEQSARFSQNFGVDIAPDALSLASSSEIVLFAVKPQDAKVAFTPLAPAFKDGERLALSIIAGLSMAKISAWLGEKTPIARVMPNTPIQVGEGASILAFNQAASKADRNAAIQLFSSGGLAREAKESDLDAVTALSGSGPAYVFLFMEALEKAAQEMGLPEELAGPLVLQTLKGAVFLAEKSAETPAALRAKVTSKGGTTAAALHIFEMGNFESLVVQALKAARDRSLELGS